MAAAEATGLTFVDEDDPPSAVFACILSTTTILQALLTLIETNCRKSGPF